MYFDYELQLSLFLNRRKENPEPNNLFLHKFSGSNLI